MVFFTNSTGTDNVIDVNVLRTNYGNQSWIAPWIKKIGAIALGLFAYFHITFSHGIIGALMSFFAQMEPKNLFGPNGFVNASTGDILSYLWKMFWPQVIGTIIAKKDFIMGKPSWKTVSGIDVYKEIVRLHFFIFAVGFLGPVFVRLLGHYQKPLVLVFLALSYLQVERIFRSDTETDNKVLKHVGRSLPISYREKGSGAGIFIMGMGAFFTAIPGSTIILQIKKHTFNPAILIVGLFAVVGIVIFLLGLRLFFSRTRFEITNKEVTYKSFGDLATASLNDLKSIVGKKEEWTEPLGSYAGVVCREEFHSGGKNHSSYTLRLIFLKHKDNSKKDIELYRAKSDTGLRQEAENFAKLFKLPMLSEDASDQEGFISQRAPNELDKSIKDLAAEGKISTDFNPSTSIPGKKLRLIKESGGYAVYTSFFEINGKVPKGVYLCVMLPVIPFVLFIFKITKGFHWLHALTWGPVIPLFVLTGIIAGVAARIGFSHEILRVSRTMIILEQWFFGRKLSYKSLEADAIEEVVIKKEMRDKNAGGSGGGGFNVLRIISDSDTINFGAHLSDEEQNWVKNLITHVITS